MPEPLVCSLKDKKCKPCEGGIAALTKQEAEQLLATLPGWTLNETATEISREFQFKSFKGPLALANKFGEMAEEEKHHPDITIGWGKCQVRYTTHAINGLSENDFICAAKASEIYEQHINSLAASQVKKKSRM